MNEIGQLFRVTREGAGVSLIEASKDLDIKEVILENIEEGNIGCFKDIFVLKNDIYNYAKYLGINPDKVVDDFNEYMFEYTSKIPVKEIEKQINDQQINKKEVESPYTKEEKKSNKGTYILIYACIIFLVIAAVFWSVKQITRGKVVATTISYVK